MCGVKQPSSLGFLRITNHISQYIQTFSVLVLTDSLYVLAKPCSGTLVSQFSALKLTSVKTRSSGEVILGFRRSN